MNLLLIYYIKLRLINPHIPKDALSGGTNLYKIKLKSAGYRLVYAVDDIRITVLVLSIGKRNRNEVYKKLTSRLEKNKYVQEF